MSIKRWKDAIDHQIKYHKYVLHPDHTTARLELPAYVGKLTEQEQEELAHYYETVWKECRINPVLSPRKTWIVTLTFR